MKVDYDFDEIGWSMRPHEEGKTLKLCHGEILQQPDCLNTIRLVKINPLDDDGRGAWINSTLTSFAQPAMLGTITSQQMLQSLQKT